MNLIKNRPLIIAAGICTCAGALLLMRPFSSQPRPTGTYAAVGRATHISIYNIQPDNSEKLHAEVWISGNKTRIDTKRRVDGKDTNEIVSYLKKDGIIYKYEPQRKVAHVEKNLELIEGDHWNWFFLHSLKRDTLDAFDTSLFTKRNPYDKVAKITYQGRPANEILSPVGLGERFTQTRRIEFLDPTPKETTHPTIWIEESTGKLLTRLDVDLDATFSDSVFETNYPKDTRVWEYKKEKAFWDAKLKKPVATMHLDDRTFNILNVQRNAFGQVFLLYTYTAGKPRPDGRTAVISGATTDWKFTLTDAQGRRYIPASQNLGVFNDNPTAFEWFILLEPLPVQEAKRPTTLQVEIAAASPRLTHGTDRAYFKGLYNASLHRAGKYIAGSLSFTNVSPCDEQPGYMELLNEQRTSMFAPEMKGAEKRAEYWAWDAPYLAPQNKAVNARQSEKSNDDVRRLREKYGKPSEFLGW
jgi:hypothetical protein